VERKSSSADGANDGTASLWVDGVVVETLSGLDTDTYQLGRFKLGAWSMASTTTGTLNLDNFHLSQSTPTPTPTATATPTGPQTYRYVYDGDGALVLRIAGEVRIYSPGKHYDEEVTGNVTTVKKYYSLNGQTVAVRTVQGETDTLNWILTDHLGSTTVTAAEDGSKLAELRYSAFGEVRFSSGTTPTEYQYTGQLNVSTIQLSWYNSRWYDSELGQFIQPDTIIPDVSIPGAWNRFLYVLGNPIIFIDPSGKKNIIFDDERGNPVIDRSSTTKYSDNGKWTQHGDTDKLTKKGERALDYYNWARVNPGWWNDYGSLPMEKRDANWFVGVFILQERNGIAENTQKYIDSVGNQLFMGVNKSFIGEGWRYCTGDVQFNCIFNFIAAYSLTAMDTRWGSGDASVLGDSHPGFLDEEFNDSGNPEPFGNEAVDIGNAIITNRAVYEANTSLAGQSNADYFYHWGNTDEYGNMLVDGKYLTWKNASGHILILKYYGY
jgi:RHS repeat-associated protein